MSALRNRLADAVSVLLRQGLLDFTGGALSLRTGTESFAITPGGSARRFWNISEDDIVVVSPTGSDPRVRLPLGARLHEYLYQAVPSLGAIVHTHSGCMFIASCVAHEGLPILPATAPLGAIPMLGAPGPRLPSDELPVDDVFSSTEWVEAVTIPEVRSLVDEWALKLDGAGVAFLDYQHGAYVLGSSVEAAIVDLARLESSCRLWMFAEVSGRSIQASRRPWPKN